MPDFEANMKDMMLMSPQGYEDMLNCHPSHWCRAYFNTEVKCDIVDNNLIEAFNGMIVEFRTKNIYSMLEDIRKLVMNRLRDNKDKCDRWLCDFGPRIRKKIYDNCVESTKCHMLWNGNHGFEVEYKGETYRVDLKKKTCPCRAWQLTRIPCHHAICAIHHIEKNPEDYIHSIYRKEKYKMAYAHMMEGLNSKKFWTKKEVDPPQPPPDRRMPGRPAKNRRKEEGEGKSRYKLSRHGRKMTCQVCYQTGHNKKTCPELKNSMAAQRNSQSTPTSRPEKLSVSIPNLCSINLDF